MLTNRRLWLSSCTGVEIKGLSDDTFSCRYCRISIKGEKLFIEEKEEFTGRFNEVLPKIPNDRAIALVLTGKGVLTKRSGPDNVKAADTLFPNLKADDFYIQEYNSGIAGFFSVIRRAVADNILRKVAASGLEVLSVSLGPFPVTQVQAQLNHYGTELVFDGHCVEMENGAWRNCRFEEVLRAKYELKIESDRLDEKYLISYAGAFQLALFNQLIPIKIELKEVNKVLSDFREKRKFHFDLRMILGLFLGSLFLNFLVLTHYTSENEDLQVLVDQSTAGENLNKELRTKMEVGEELLKDIGWQGGVSKAYILDDIGRSMPSDVMLDEISDLPRSKRRFVTLKGKAKNAETIAKWISGIKERHWVRNVELQSFSPSEDTENRQIFELLIWY